MISTGSRMQHSEEIVGLMGSPVCHVGSDEYLAATAQICPWLPNSVPSVEHERPKSNIEGGRRRPPKGGEESEGPVGRVDDSREADAPERGQVLADLAGGNAWAHRDSPGRVRKLACFALRTRCRQPAAALRGS